MKRKYKILFMISIIIVITLLFGITYSAFHSKADVIVEDQKLAKFVVNSEKQDHLELSLVDLNPGDKEKYSFLVSNNDSSKKSNVTINYQIIIKTFHLMPVTIELYKKSGDDKTLILTCDENYSRNENNELVCNSEVQELNFKENNSDSYELEVNFSKEYDGEEFSNLVDYFDVEIKSWQK